VATQAISMVWAISLSVPKTWRADLKDVSFFFIEAGNLTMVGPRKILPPAGEFTDMRQVLKAQRQSKLEAYQCPHCRGWLSTSNGGRLHCFRCEQEAQASEP